MRTDPTKTRISQMDADEKAIYEAITGRVNEFNRHRIDEDKLLDEVERIIEGIEEVALEVEEGLYELPEPERND